MVNHHASMLSYNVLIKYVMILNSNFYYIYLSRLFTYRTLSNSFRITARRNYCRNKRIKVEGKSNTKFVFSIKWWRIFIQFRRESPDRTIKKQTNSASP